MHTTIKNLLITLNDEVVGYREMNQILADEKDAMQLSGKALFDQVQKDKEAMVGKLHAFEVKRRQLVDQLAEDCSLGPEAVTVSQLVRFIQPPYDQELLARANELRSIIADVQASNLRNQQLINHYLSLIKGSLKLLTHLIEDNSIYQKPGAHQSAVGYQRRGGRLICGTA